MAKYGIRRIICLTPIMEIRSRSEEYYQMVSTDQIPWAFDHFPIPDFGVPRDWDAFLDLTLETALRIQKGERILIHCYAGVGRTGTFAMVLMMALGMNRLDGAAVVRVAKAHPEGEDQQGLIDWCEDMIQKRFG